MLNTLRCACVAAAAAAAAPAQFRNPLADAWGSVGLWRVGPGTLTLMNMACVAFMAHYNGVKYYEELEVRAAAQQCLFVSFLRDVCCSGSGWRSSAWTCAAVAEALQQAAAAAQQCVCTVALPRRRHACQGRAGAAALRAAAATVVVQALLRWQSDA
jgi:hypothetical protein